MLRRDQQEAGWGLNLGEVQVQVSHDRGRWWAYDGSRAVWFVEYNVNVNAQGKARR